MLASAPGKVLILGGYLIVQAPNVGISIGVNARFTTRVVRSAPSAVEGRTVVHIASPQFQQNFSFQCTRADGVVSVEQTAGPKSPFIFYSILYGVTASLIRGDVASEEIHLELQADNDFYSQRNYLEAHQQEVNVANLRALPKHLPLVGEVSKTGLGSSAAMTTSLVACLCSHFSKSLDTDIEFIHRVAQIAHSVTQGKIGSGFDVFTAVYGTCAYSRFPAQRVELLMKGAENPLSASVAQLSECIDMSSQWVSYEPFRLPEGLKLVLGDVHCGGSSTPGMVAKIMSWQKSVADQPNNLWELLRTSNEEYIGCLRQLVLQATNTSADHTAAVSALGSVTLSSHCARGAAEEAFMSAFQSAAKCRRLLREMGIAAGVEVEPRELTDLLDDTAALPGVFAVGCPGAGGYDAVFALVIGQEQCEAVERFWEGYKKLNVCPLLVREDPSGLIIKE